MLVYSGEIDLISWHPEKENRSLIYGKLQQPAVWNTWDIVSLQADPHAKNRISS